MKTLLALLIAGMIFLAVPVSASAGRGGHDSRRKYDQGQMQRNRHNFNQYNRHYNPRYEQKRNYRAKRNLRWERHETRHDRYWAKRRIRHNRRHTYYVGQPVVLIGIPPLVFLFDW